MTETIERGSSFAQEVAGLFPVFDDDAAPSPLELDLSDLGAKEAARQFAQADRILEGFQAASESISPCLEAALTEARSRVKEARRVAERHAEQAGD